MQVTSILGVIPRLSRKSCYQRVLYHSLHKKSIEGQFIQKRMIFISIITYGKKYNKYIDSKTHMVYYTICKEAIDMICEVSATILGLIQGYLAMLNKRSNWIFYMLQMIFLIVFSAFNNLYGDIVNNGIYLLMGVVGFVIWNNKTKEKKITKANKLERVIYVIIILVGTAFIYGILKTTDDPLPLLDAFTTVSSFVATYYMMKKKIDTWVIWFINDVFYAIEYFILPNQAIYLFLLNLIWTFMAVGSYINWRKLMKGDGING